MARAIRRVMEESGMVPRDIGAITVTATGSPVYDQMQSRAVRLALAGEADRIPVTTWEPAIGHALASTAVLGLVHAAQSLREKSVLPFRHEGESDPACSLRHLREPMPLENRAILALTVGFGGQNGATLISPPPVEEKS